MTETLAPAGDGPAHEKFLEEDIVPASVRLRAALAACENMLGNCTGIASDKEETSTARMLAAATAAKLAAASALAASAIAKLADAETHQRLAGAKIDLSQQPRARRPARRVSVTRDDPGYAPGDWRAWRDEEEDSESEESTNNRGPKIWSP